MKRTGQVPPQRAALASNQTMSSATMPCRADGVSHYLHVNYVDGAALESSFGSPDTYPLAVIGFGAPSTYRTDFPVVSLDLPRLNDTPLIEVWTSALPVTYHEGDGMRLASNGAVLFGHLEIEETCRAALDTVTASAYQRLLRQVMSLGYPHLWRIWNHFPSINADGGGLERYQQFCMGRYHALMSHLPKFPETVPAATAVGTRSGPLQIYFIAGTQPGLHVGNPRQMNAYDYPPVYSPRSPSFARATLRQTEDGVHLFIAGTASVIGHASRHTGSPAEQTRETLRNIQALIAHTEENHPSKLQRLNRRTRYKVYLRHAEDLPAVRDIVHDALPTDASLLFLQGDLCRKELLVEIEGVVTPE